MLFTRLNQNTVFWIDSRPDIYVVDPDSGKEVELDIPLAHPWALDTLPKAALEDGTAATRREMLKNDKYAKKAHWNYTEFHSSGDRALRSVGARGPKISQPALINSNVDNSVQTR